MMVLNRLHFFESIRTHLFEGHLLEPQVVGASKLLDFWEGCRHSAKPEIEAEDDRWLAYVLATAYHETARTMQPIEEFGKGVGHDYGKPDPTTGHRYYGRGLVQLTHAHNYQEMGERLGIPLYQHPDLACDPDVSVRIIFVGMAEGRFTGKKLADYFPPKNPHCNWFDARRIINGLDRAVQIASFARSFYSALSYL